MQTRFRLLLLSLRIAAEGLTGAVRVRVRVRANVRLRVRVRIRVRVTIGVRFRFRIRRDEEWSIFTL